MKKEQKVEKTWNPKNKAQKQRQKQKLNKKRTKSVSFFCSGVNFEKCFRKQFTHNYAILESYNFTVVRHRMNLLVGGIDQAFEQDLTGR